MKYSVFLICAMLLLSGCPMMFMPHTVNVTPHFRGIVTDDNAPLTDVRIAISREYSDIECNKPEAIAYTDKDGFFELKPQIGLRFFYHMMAREDEILGLYVCVENEGSVYLGQSYNYISSNNSWYLDCDIKARYKSHGIFADSVEAPESVVCKSECQKRL